MMIEQEVFDQNLTTFISLYEVVNLDRIHHCYHTQQIGT